MCFMCGVFCCRGYDGCVVCRGLCVECRVLYIAWDVVYYGHMVVFAALALAACCAPRVVLAA